MAVDLSTDQAYMKMALGLARRGLGRTSPNPCVGAVVVKGGQVVGKGWHRRAGEPHAEINALSAAGELARGGTIYVTLEPCNHHGRTPPCSKAILAAGISRVVYGMADPNPMAGGGGACLAGGGLEVVAGVLADDCRRLNLSFSKRVNTGRPWVLLKAAVSLDGRIATASGRSKWITGEQARHLVHRLRDRNDAILVGSGTVLADDPSLTTRLPGGVGRDPLRVILDRHLTTPPAAKVVAHNSPAATWIFCGPEAEADKEQRLQRPGVEIRRVGLEADGTLRLGEVLDQLGQAGITTLLVEGGGRVHGSFLRLELADEVAFFIAPLLIGGDGMAVVGELGLTDLGRAPRLHEIERRRCGEDFLIRGLLRPLTGQGS
ncbi:bifunctional diaminohydroxyphosphoribosylaminopyrimidine deaminase/5-amino-6-(5-phosphoribosylamino)uracil reductase RibD [Desulfurivibrio dismutans]|uniref:bifunctional diaminohydroxyphosphoribosylaminopyrimidine deaminase/5-amino-6-(5-phosphoribosylamino)uracil reductase RibD n=1 Tax=Desulfurivibrio dismutans TaxID=1398908 RepID=UPI0023DCAFE5|nr:bifunctional diaminohydroxyphosphoribosylaminopyrimidine deaminase/5-amino-6-(5-phosphoribosylamino)uracil reductase RibD [Desulfurivibrio alkaliphilus]MDF1613637.1 bifunctional diaminohydroxyphosphoribosylaminopyrimidine deaminase/5-amino-6-(5-phosphoribosylamino)uracil reductase RibD [Desulfurivibrio alkaliphilus]